MLFCAPDPHRRSVSDGDIGDSTCGGFIGFNVSAVPDPVADAKLKADAETMIGWGMDSLKVVGTRPEPIPITNNAQLCSGGVHRTAVRTTTPRRRSS